MPVRYHWAAIGCGTIANEMAKALESAGGGFYSVANRRREKAVSFAGKYGIPKVYEKISDVFADPEVDIVYVATPHNHHIEYIRQALKAGKHVLCEKAITLNSEELSEAMGLAEENRVVVAEAQTIYHMPVYGKLDAYARSGALGKFRLAQINFGSAKPYDTGSRFFSRALAGGALLDIGVYALSLARRFMSSCPDEILSMSIPAPTGVDEADSILLKNREGEMASITLTLRVKQPKRGLLAFEKGYVEVYDYPRAQKAVITFTEDGHTETIEAGNTEDALVYEVRDMENAVSGGKNVMRLSDTADVMHIMTECRSAWGLVYPEEEM